MTTEARVRLEAAHFVALFKDNRADWVRLGRLAYAYAYDIYASEEVEDSPFPDDVSQHLALALAVNATFLDHRNERATRAKYWAQEFADLIVTLAWDDISAYREED